MFGNEGNLRVTVPLASGIYKCPEHGYWRIYITGAMEKVEPRQEPLG